MATGHVAAHLTLDEFELLYGAAEPHYEYWDGEAIQKPMPTILHSLLQAILIRLLHDIGLLSGGEIRLKLSPTKQPLPDVIAGSRLQHPYPTKPFEVAIEILSPDDRMQRILRKCRFYAEQGIPHIYVFDPEDRTAERWNGLKGTLEPVEAIAVENWPRIEVSQIWAELDKELERVDGI